MEISSLLTRFTPKLLIPIYQFLVGKYEEKYTSPMYDESHKKYKLKTSTGQFWFPIYGNLEVSFQMSPHFCKESSRIAIRNNSEEVLKQVTLFVETENRFDGIFKDEYDKGVQGLVFNDVGLGSQSCSIDIPPIDCWTDNGKVFFFYENIYVRIESVVKNENTEIIQYRNRIISFCKGQYLDDLSKGNWQEKNGKYFHIGYINDAKDHLKRKLFGDLNPPPVWLTREEEEEYSETNIVLRNYWKFCSLASGLTNSIRCYFLLQDKIISARFWILVTLKRHSEDADGRLKFDQYTLL